MEQGYLPGFDIPRPEQKDAQAPAYTCPNCHNAKTVRYLESAKAFVCWACGYVDVERAAKAK